METMIKYETSLGAVELSPETVKRYLVRGNGAVSEQEIMLFMKLDGVSARYAFILRGKLFVSFFN